MLNIIKFPNTILTEKMPDFDFTDPIVDPVKLEEEMLALMYAFDGIGLAANQVGIKTRMFVMGHASNTSEGRAFFNPVIVENTSDIVLMEEGCLSFPGIYVNIPRPTAIKARWQDSKGEWNESEFDGYNCKCFLHEYDHLEGITYKDRISSLRWAMASKKTKSYKGKK